MPFLWPKTTRAAKRSDGQVELRLYAKSADGRGPSLRVAIGPTALAGLAWTPGTTRLAIEYDLRRCRLVVRRPKRAEPQGWALSTIGKKAQIVIGGDLPPELLTSIFGADGSNGLFSGGSPARRQATPYRISSRKELVISWQRQTGS